MLCAVGKEPVCFRPQDILIHKHNYSVLLHRSFSEIDKLGYIKVNLYNKLLNFEYTGHLYEIDKTNMRLSKELIYIFNHSNENTSTLYIKATISSLNNALILKYKYAFTDVDIYISLNLISGKPSVGIKLCTNL